MTSVRIYISETSEADRSEYARIAAATFGWNEAKRKACEETLAPDEVRLVRIAGEAVGGLRILPIRQHFGGCAVRAWGVSTVAVVAHKRGAGVGRFMMTSLIREMADRKVPVAVLHPMTLDVYQAVGFGQAGVRTPIDIPIALIPETPQPCAVRPATHEDAARLRALRIAYRMPRNGSLAPDEAVAAAAADSENPATTFIFEHDAEPVATLSVVFLSTHGARVLLITDFAATTDTGVRACLALLRGYASLARFARIHAEPSHPLLARLPEYHRPAGGALPWMLRLTDIREALESRGTHATDTRPVAVRVTDDLIATNNACWLISAKDGHLGVSPTTTASVQISVSGFAALYTGFRDIDDLWLLDEVAGDMGAARRLGTFFAGPTPACPELF